MTMLSKALGYEGRLSKKSVLSPIRDILTTEDMLVEDS